jgi:hypothetical protein
MGHVGVIAGHGDVKSGESVTVASVYVDGANAEKEGSRLAVALLGGKVKSCAAARAGDGGGFAIAVV